MTLPSLEQVVTSINQVQSTIEVVSSSDSHAKVNANRLPRHFPPDLSEPQTIPRIMDNNTGRTEQPSGTCTEV